MNRIRKHKWAINWVLLSVIICLIVFFAILFEDKSWLPNFLQAVGTIAGIYLTILLFLQSNESSDKQFREHLDHLKSHNENQILALQASTDKQIRILQELNNKQITALQELTEKQIEALHKTTFDQITSFEKELKEVTTKLSDNSILLAEILGRELEKSLDIYNNAIKSEEAKYSDISGWKLFRTKEERKDQLEKQWTRIQQIKRGYEYLVDKYNKVRDFLGFGQKRLNG